MSHSLKNYLRKLSKTQEENKFILPWGIVVLRNCDQNGDFLTFKNIGDFKKGGKDKWLVIQLLLFRENEEIFPIFQCPECPEMKPLSGLALDQTEANLLSLRCIHSQAAAYIADPWDYHWPVEVIEESEESHKVECNLDIKTQQLRNDKFFWLLINMMVRYLCYSLSVQTRSIHFAQNAPAKSANVLEDLRKKLRMRQGLMKIQIIFGKD